MDWQGSQDGPSERQFAIWAEEYRALNEFEERAFLRHGDPGADCFDRTPEKSELFWDQIERDDAKFYDHHEALR